jgi:hypothetical protein
MCHMPRWQERDREELAHKHPHSLTQILAGIKNISFQSRVAIAVHLCNCGVANVSHSVSSRQPDSKTVRTLTDSTAVETASSTSAYAGAADREATVTISASSALGPALAPAFACKQLVGTLYSVTTCVLYKVRTI